MLVVHKTKAVARAATSDGMEAISALLILVPPPYAGAVPRPTFQDDVGMLGIEPEGTRDAGDPGADVEPMLDARYDHHPDTVVRARRFGAFHYRLSNSRDEQVGFDFRAVILPIFRRWRFCGRRGRVWPAACLG